MQHPSSSFSQVASSRHISEEKEREQLWSQSERERERHLLEGQDSLAEADFHSRYPGWQTGLGPFDVDLHSHTRKNAADNFFCSLSLSLPDFPFTWLSKSGWHPRSNPDLKLHQLTLYIQMVQMKLVRVYYITFEMHHFSQLDHVRHLTFPSYK